MDITYDVNYDKKLNELFKAKFDGAISQIKSYGEINSNSNFQDFLNNNFNAYAITFYELKFRQATNIFEDIFYEHRDDIDEHTAIKMLTFNQNIKKNCEEKLNAFLDMPYEDKVKFYKEMTVEMNHKTLMDGKVAINAYLIQNKIDDNSLNPAVKIRPEHKDFIDKFNSITSGLQKNFIKDNEKSIKLINQVYKELNTENTEINNTVENKRRIKMKA